MSTSTMNLLTPTFQICCYCGLPAAMFTVRKEESPSFGRKFYSCHKNQDDPARCQFFRYDDDLPNTTLFLKLDQTMTMMHTLIDYFKKQGNPTQNKVMQKPQTSSMPQNTSHQQYPENYQGQNLSHQQSHVNNSAHVTHTQSPIHSQMVGSSQSFQHNKSESTQNSSQMSTPQSTSKSKDPPKRQTKRVQEQVSNPPAKRKKTGKNENQNVPENIIVPQPPVNPNLTDLALAFTLDDEISY